MVKVALFVRLEAKPGKEKEVESFLLGGLPLVEEEPATTAWFGIRLGPSTFGIFDAFPDEAGREAHLSGKVAAALMAKAPELFATLRPSYPAKQAQQDAPTDVPAAALQRQDAAEFGPSPMPTGIKPWRGRPWLSS